MPTVHDATAPWLLKAWIIALMFGGLVWTLVGMGAALAMARSWFVPVGWFGAFALFLMTVGALPLADRLVIFLAAAGCLAATIAAFTVAWKRNLVTRRTLIGAVTAYVFLLANCLLALNEGIISLDVFLPLIGFAALPLAPLPVAPLALAWNRHR